MADSFQVYEPSGMVDGTKAIQFRQHIQKLLEGKPKVIVLSLIHI